MRREKCFGVLVAFLYALCGGSAVAQQCSSANGAPWTDGFGFLWTLNQSASGTVVVWGCQVPTWYVYGSYSNGQVQVTAYNPAWDDFGCVNFFSYWAMLQGGCNVGDGSWTYSQGSGGSWAWAKTCEVPSSETTGSGGYWDGPYYIFPASMSNTTGGNLSGRAVAETELYAV